MAKRHESALKAHRHSQRRRLINKANKGRLRTALRSIRLQLAAGKIDEARASLPGIHSILDKMIRKKVIHRNAAARYKARLTKRILAKAEPPGSSTTAR